MNKIKHNIIPLVLLIVLLVSCTSTKNTSLTRWYHSFNTRYNVYFNGEEAFKEAYKTQHENYEENYSEFIYMYPVSSLDKEKVQSGGPYEKSIEKAIKAIKTHSIKTKPKKDAGKRNDPKYQEFMNRDEYNPFLHNAWELLGKSQFYNGDFLTAASTFSYISRHYSTQPEISAPAKIWQARCYAEVGWLYEAEDILSKVNNPQLPKGQSDWLSSVYADYLIKKKQYNEAIPYLQTAIKAEKNKRQKARMKYLLGQIYASLDQKEMAYKTFVDVAKSNPPYKLEFSAKIRQTEVYPGGNIKKVTDMLKKMTKSSKNKEYLDQVYYAMGNVYMTVPDTVKAIESYSEGVKKSTQNGMDKALCQIKLGDIYFQQREYIKAQPCYSEASGQLKKEHKDYNRVTKRSEVLDELVIHAEAVQLQDSLQQLGRMPEAERMAVITKIIKEIEEKEKKEKEEKEKEELLAKQDLMMQDMGPRAMRSANKTGPVVENTAMASSEKSSFYFYSPQMVATGKNTFQQTWGRRKLEDDWRRRKKLNNDPLEDLADNTDNKLLEGNIPNSDIQAADDTSSTKTDEENQIADMKDPKFYLQQIPSTEEDFEASDLIIADGLYNMGVIFKDKLEDYPLSIENFDLLEKRFPKNEFKLDTYHHLYLIYLKLDNMQMANFYKSKIRSEFPESDLAIAMADPNYEYNLKMMNIVQDSIYQKTYESYLNGNAYEIRNNYETFSNKYSQSTLMPKFMFLNALSFVQTNEPDTFKVRLKELIEKYPEADVSVLAEEMMKGFKKGLTLSGNGNLTAGGLFNMRFGLEGDSTVIDTTITFSAERNTPHLLMLIFPTGSVNRNVMLYNVAEFNFSNFMVNDFDLQFETFGDISMLQISGFNSYREIFQYIQMIQRPEGYYSKLDPEVIAIPISSDNLSTLMKGKSLDEYILFFKENFGSDHPRLIQKWESKQKEEILKLSEEEEKETILDILPDETEMNKDLQPEKAADTEIKTTGEPEQNQKDKEIIDSESISQEKEKDTETIPVKQSEEVISEDNKAADSKAISGEEVMDKANKTAEDASEKLDDVNKTIDEISKDPVRGIKNLFSKQKKSNAIDDYVKEQEKQEKERQKQLKKEQDQKAKDDRELKKQQDKDNEELLKRQKADEEALLKEKQQREKDLEKIKDQEEKQKADAKKQEELDRKNELKKKQEEREWKQKQREDERKAKDKQRKEDREKKEKQRKEEQKLKEQKRKEDQKKKEDERKAKQKQRKSKN